MSTKKVASSSLYPLHSPAQLATYLQSLRKEKQLTQTQLGEMLGVTRARVSEIEVDPSNIGFTQLQRILHLLGARLVIEASGPQREPTADSGTPNRGEW